MKVFLNAKDTSGIATAPLSPLGFRERAYLGVVHCLIEANADVKGFARMTALHWSSRDGHLEVRVLDGCLQ